jgi:hypothetical protein
MVLISDEKRPFFSRTNDSQFQRASSALRTRVCYRVPVYRENTNEQQPSNVMPDKERGISKWTADQSYAMMHTGRSPGDGPLYPDIPRYISRDAVSSHDLKFPYNNRRLKCPFETAVPKFLPEALLIERLKPLRINALGMQRRSLWDKH